MNRRAWLLRYWRRVLGWPGVAGIGLLALAGLYYGAASLPLRLDLADVRQQVADIQAQAAAPARDRTLGAGARLAAFYDEFPPRETAPAWLEKVYAAGTQAGLGLERGEYRLSADRASRLLGYEINLPVKGSYVQVRQFVQAVLDAIPTIALRDLQVRRANIGEPNVDAQIRFILYLRETAG